MLTKLTRLFTGTRTAKVIHIYDPDGNKLAEKGVCECDDCMEWWEWVAGIAVGIVLWWVQAVI